MADAASPDPIDVHVGRRIRLRRKQIGMSQQALASTLGLTFQQVQKYERGANRVSSSMLVKTARRLEVGISYFFEGLPDLPGGDPDMTAEAEAMEALIAVPAVRIIPRLSRVRQKALQSMLTAMAEIE